MVDMLALGSVNMDEAKPPPEIAEGIYTVTNLKYKFGPSRFAPGDDCKVMLTIETQPNGPPDGFEGDLGFDVTKRRIFKEFELDQRDVNSFYFLRMYLNAAGIETKGRGVQEVLPELTGTTSVLAYSRREYNRKDGTPGVATDVRMVIDGKVITERR